MTALKPSSQGLVMKQILCDHELSSLNTMGLRSVAEYFLALDNVDDLGMLSGEIIDPPRLILGGGSNLLIPPVIKGLVVNPLFKGIKIIKEDNERCLVEVAAGEKWHDFVIWSVKKGLWGIENLALIPGSVGAAPVQNVGAYGVELCQVIDYVEGFSFQHQKIIRYFPDQCEFGYRSSLFKNKLKDNFLITAVAIRLSKLVKPCLNYGPLKTFAKTINKKNLGSLQVAQEVIRIRQSKLPDPNLLGNAGSFYKNPILSDQKYQKLSKQYPDLVAYPQSDKHTKSWKIAAGWLIEKAGFKGFRNGQVGVHTQQALVLVNYGGGSYEEILALSADIESEIEKRFNISLEKEIRLVKELK